MNFIKDSAREIKHVVWPTKEETLKYFLIVVSILIFFWLYLFIFSTIFGNSLQYIKSIVNPTVTTLHNNHHPHSNNTIDSLIWTWTLNKTETSTSTWKVVPVVETTKTGSTNTWIVTPVVTSTWKIN